MRAVSVVASCVLLLVLAAVSVDASVFAGKTKAPASASKKHLGQKGAFIKPAELYAAKGAVGDSNEWGPTYRMAYDLLVAFETRNFTWASSLIADDAMGIISAVGCGTLTKQQLIGAAQNDHAIARYFQFGTWAGYEAGSFGAIGTIGAIGGPDSGFTNQTAMIDNAVFYFVPSQDGTQLSIIEQLTDRSWAQPNNATQLRRVWEQMADSANLHDVTAFSNLFNEDSEFFLHYAWNQAPPMQLNNKSAIVSTISNAWAHQSKFGVKTNWVSVMCDIVIAQFTWHTLTNANGGGPQIMNFLMSIVVDDQFKVSQFNEFPLMPFL